MNEAARRMAALSAEGAYNVTMDSPLLIRLLEFAREEARSDAVLHKLAERVATRGASLILGMDDYAWLVRGLGPDYPASEFDPSAATPPVPAPPPADVAEVAPVAVTAATKRWQVVATLEGQRVDVDVVEAGHLLAAHQHLLLAGREGHGAAEEAVQLLVGVGVAARGDPALRHAGVTEAASRIVLHGAATPEVGGVAVHGIAILGRVGAAWTTACLASSASAMRFALRSFKSCSRSASE